MKRVSLPPVFMILSYLFVVFSVVGQLTLWGRDGHQTEPPTQPWSFSGKFGDESSSRFENINKRHFRWEFFGGLFMFMLGTLKLRSNDINPFDSKNRQEPTIQFDVAQKWNCSVMITTRTTTAHNNNSTECQITNLIQINFFGNDSGMASFTKSAKSQLMASWLTSQKAFRCNAQTRLKSICFPSTDVDSLMKSWFQLALISTLRRPKKNRANGFSSHRGTTLWEPLKKFGTRILPICSTLKTLLTSKTFWNITAIFSATDPWTQTHGDTTSPTWRCDGDSRESWHPHQQMAWRRWLRLDTQKWYGLAKGVIP